MSFLDVMEKSQIEILDLLKVLATKIQKYSPNGGSMVIYHGRK